MSFDLCDGLPILSVFFLARDQPQLSVLALLSGSADPAVKTEQNHFKCNVVKNNCFIYKVTRPYWA